MAEELARRFGLPRWRFTNSGTEANMAAIRLARAFTGREAVVQMAGAYHGHAEISHAARGRHFNDASGARAPSSGRRRGAGLRYHGGGDDERRARAPRGRATWTRVRELTRRHGVVLILDEVKTGLTIAAGGAVERLGARPDIVTLAKSLGGGLPTGAVGMTAELAEPVEDGRLRLLGTYNGNPLSMAAAAASLHRGAHARRVRGARAARRADGGRLRGPDPGERTGGALRRPRLEGLRALGIDGGSTLEAARSELIWIWLMNRGVLTTAGRGQEWNVTVAHDDEAVERYLEAFAGLVGRAQSTIVRLCSRMNCGRYQAPRPPLPVEPLDFQPQNVCVPGHAPVVAPARRFT